MILEDDGPEEITTQAYFDERPSKAYYETPRPKEPDYPPPLMEQRPARYEAPEHPGDEMGRVAMAVDRLTDRIEQSESRTGIAISGVEHSVREAVARIEASEREHIAVAARFEGGLDELMGEQRGLADRLRRMEKEEAGPRSAEAMHALETALGKVATHLYEGETRARDSFQALEERIDQVAGRELPAADPAAVIDEVIAQVGARLTAAESRTAEALKGLGEAFATLDGRLRNVETGAGPAMEQRLEALAATLTARVEASRADIAQKLQASADGRFDRMERTLGEVAEHVRQAEHTSAQAIERMGQEVLTIADNLNRRVQTAENRSAEAIEQVGGEVARIAQAVETRLGRADSVHAEALERLGAEIGRITERLTERMGAGERRSAQAIDDVGEQVARVTERIQQRQDRASEELADRIRQSEERTARLLAEARDTIDRGLAENQRRIAEQVAAPQRLVREEPAAPFRDEAFPAFGPAEPSADPFTPEPFTKAEPAASPFAAEPERPEFDSKDFEAADGFAHIEEDTSPALGDQVADDDDLDRTIADEPELEPMQLSEHLVPVVEEPEEEDEAPLSMAEDFGASRRDRLEADDLGADSDYADAETGTAPDEEASRPLSTREVIEQARAAARVAANNGGAKTKAAKPAASGDKTSGFTLFSGFGARPKRRAGSSLQTALLITGGAAFLSLGAAGMMIAGGEPKGELPKRVADSLALGKAGEVKAAEADTTPFGANPRVSVALAPQPLSNPAPTATVPGPELVALYEEAVRTIEANQPGGLDKLRQAANLGHSPSQFYLSKLYENGKGGVAKDLTEARRWTERAAQNGNRHAMHNLAIAYVDGKGGPKNTTTASQWFRRAADLGLVDSQYNLGALNEQGLGVAQNAAEAYKWYLIAARTGDEEAQKSAARVRAGLSPEARVVAERAAAAFRASTTNASTPVLAANSTSAAVGTAQRALSRLGYYRGPADGIPSPALQGAVSQYQRDQGLTPTGALDQVTVSRLSVFTR